MKKINLFTLICMLLIFACNKDDIQSLDENTETLEKIQTRSIYINPTQIKAVVYAIYPTPDRQETSKQYRADFRNSMSQFFEIYSYTLVQESNNCIDYEKWIVNLAQYDTYINTIPEIDYGSFTTGTEATPFTKKQEEDNTNEDEDEALLGLGLGIYLSSCN